jgi:predicted dithiol-disulfide oxidoreductase (DUF899 family)
MHEHRIVSSRAWVEARKAFLEKEKEFTRARDALSQARRELPWTAVDKTYRFQGPSGEETLAELFAGRSQLVVYHFMFAPGWKAGCPHCSFWADNFNPVVVHLNEREVTLIAVSRAPYAQLAEYRKRMGWSFKWVSSYETDFNSDFQVSFTPEQVARGRAEYNFASQPIEEPDATEREGVSVFYKDDTGRVFRTYSTYARGIDLLNTAYNFLDLVPMGRNEGDRGQFWVRRHDEYGR